MPFTASGDLRLTVEHGLGELGPKRGVPVALRWPWTNHLWALAPFALLAAPFLLRRNRTRGAAAVLLPALVLFYLWLPVRGLIGESVSELEMTLGTSAIGLGVVCLLLPWLGTGGRWRTWGLALLVGLGAEALALLSFSAGDLELLAALGPTLALPPIGTGILITSVALAARSRRAGLEPAQFVLGVPLWFAACTVAATLAMVGAIGGPGEVLAHFGQILIGVCVFGLGCFALSAPFLLLPVFSRTYRERFRVALERR